MATNQFKCQECGLPFTVPWATLKKFPNWKPKVCMYCKERINADKRAEKRKTGGATAQPAKATRATASKRRTSAAKPARKGTVAGADLTREEVLERFTEGPFDGVFTDGACSGNPGRGGWGMVWVEDDAVVREASGGAEATTNNRMELTALIAAYEALPEDAAVSIYTDSNLCVKTINEWAKGWQARGWKRKTGPVENLELVQRAYALAQAHPKVKLTWIKAHNGSRWNEYADCLATTYQRAAAKSAATGDAAGKPPAAPVPQGPTRL
jgi:ribonuclease HI